MSSLKKQVADLEQRLGAQAAPAIRTDGLADFASWVKWHTLRQQRGEPVEFEPDVNILKYNEFLTIVIFLQDSIKAVKAGQAVNWPGDRQPFDNEIFKMALKRSICAKVLVGPVDVGSLEKILNEFKKLKNHYDNMEARNHESKSAN